MLRDVKPENFLFADPRADAPLKMVCRLFFLLLLWLLLWLCMRVCNKETQLNTNQPPKNNNNKHKTNF